MVVVGAMMGVGQGGKAVVCMHGSALLVMAVLRATGQASPPFTVTRGFGRTMMQPACRSVVPEPQRVPCQGGGGAPGQAHPRGRGGGGGVCAARARRGRQVPGPAAAAGGAGGRCVGVHDSRGEVGRVGGLEGQVDPTVHARRRKEAGPRWAWLPCAHATAPTPSLHAPHLRGAALQPSASRKWTPPVPLWIGWSCRATSSRSTTESSR